MSEFFQRLKEGLEDGIRFARGELSLRTIEREQPAQPPALQALDVIRLRKRQEMSQAEFAQLLNVSVRTVQSWEQGQRKPSQAVLRLLQILQRDPATVIRISIPSQKAAKRRQKRVS